VFDLGLGQRVEVGENIGSGAALRCVTVGGRLADVGDAVLQFLLQHLGEEAARDARRHQPFRTVSPLAEQREIIGEPHRA
jgi:hypothetical protein